MPANSSNSYCSASGSFWYVGMKKSGNGSPFDRVREYVIRFFVFRASTRFFRVHFRLIVRNHSNVHSSSCYKKWTCQNWWACQNRVREYVIRFFFFRVSTRFFHVLFRLIVRNDSNVHSTSCYEKWACQSLSKTCLAHVALNVYMKKSCISCSLLSHQRSISDGHDVSTAFVLKTSFTRETSYFPLFSKTATY
jgi:hypothetical protein